MVDNRLLVVDLKRDRVQFPTNIVLRARTYIVVVPFVQHYTRNVVIVSLLYNRETNGQY